MNETQSVTGEGNAPRSFLTAPNNNNPSGWVGSGSAGRETLVAAELITNILSDGSSVYDVRLLSQGETITVPMMSLTAARSLVNQFNDMVERGVIIG